MRLINQRTFSTEARPVSVLFDLTLYQHFEESGFGAMIDPSVSFSRTPPLNSRVNIACDTQ